MPSPTAKSLDIPQAVRVSVVLPLPLSGSYDYRLPAHLVAPPGSFVEVPLGRRQMLGVVWDQAGDSGVAESRLKPVTAVLPAPPMDATLRRFVEWVAQYTISPVGAVLRMAMSSPSALEAATARDRPTTMNHDHHVGSDRRRSFRSAEGSAKRTAAKAHGIGSRLFRPNAELCRRQSLGMEGSARDAEH